MCSPVKSHLPVSDGHRSAPLCPGPCPWRLGRGRRGRFLPFVIGWSNHHFNNLHFIISSETNEMTTCAAEQSLRFVLFETQVVEMIVNPYMSSTRNLGENVKCRRFLFARDAFRRIAVSFGHVLLGPKRRWQQYAGMRPAALWQVAYERQRACKILPSASCRSPRPTRPFCCPCGGPRLQPQKFSKFVCSNKC